MNEIGRDKLASICLREKKCFAHTLGHLTKIYLLIMKSIEIKTTLTNISKDKSERERE